MSLYLKNATYIDWISLRFRKANIKVEDGINGGIEFIKDIPKNVKILDCTGKYVTKSFGCAHHHVYSALALGMPPSKVKIMNFHDILKNIWWVLDKNLDKDMIKASALSTAIACAKNGVTFVIDHHSSPNAMKGSLKIIADSFDEVGLSSLLCLELSDRDGKKKAEEGLDETDDFLSDGGQGIVGLHASFTVGDKLLKRAVSLADKYFSGLHVHVAEDLMDQEKTLKKYGKRVIERFRDADVLLYPRTILAHCLHLSGKERKIISEFECFVVENIESNLNNKVGYFDSSGLGIDIMLGTDGMHSDMLRSAKSAYFTGQMIENVSMEQIYYRFRHIHYYLNLNYIEGDSSNNLVILNYNSPTEMNEKNFLSHFIFGLESRHVESVISSGKLIVKDRKIINIDEDSVSRFSKEMAKRLWKKMSFS